jgi:hypothetical protein
MKSRIELAELNELEIEVINEYERVITGSQRVIDPYYFNGKAQDTNQRMVLMLIQYVCETYLDWTPQKMYLSLTPEVLRHWKLYSLLKFVKFPEELNKDKNIGYLAHMIYPKQVPFSNKDLCMMVYQRIESGDLKKYPKGFFSGSQGMNRVCYCLKYAIDNHLNFSAIEEMYEYFGSERCLGFLREHNLWTYMRDLFDAPITAFYLVVPEEQNIPFLFQYYRFWQVFDEHRRQENECRGKKAVHEHIEVPKEDKKYVQSNL